MHEKRPTSVLAYASYRNNLYYNINTKTPLKSLTNSITNSITKVSRPKIDLYERDYVLFTHSYAPLSRRYTHFKSV